MPSVVIELSEQQREKIREELGVDPPPTLLICADSEKNLKEELKVFDLRKGTPVAALAE